MMMTTLSIDATVTPIANDAPAAKIALDGAVDANRSGGAAFEEAVARFQSAMGEFGGSDFAAVAFGTGTAKPEGRAESAQIATPTAAALGTDEAEVPQAAVAGTGSADSASKAAGAATAPGTEEAEVPQAAVASGTGTAKPEGRAESAQIATPTVVVPGADEAEVPQAVAPRKNVAKPNDETADVIQTQPLPQQPVALAVVEAPVAAPVATQVSSVSTVDAASARTQVLVDAVEAVCDAILVTPGLLRGEGEMRIQLKADVLSGSAIHLEAKGQTLTVAFIPATPEVAALIERNLSQFEQHLAGRIHNFQIAAKVNSRVKGLKG